MPYTLNGREIQIGQEPIERNGRHFVPLKDMIENLGGRVDWDNETKIAHATIGQWTAAFTDGDTQVDVNGQQVNLSAAPYVEDGRMYVPWDSFNDVYGYKANMEDGRLTVAL